jgi:thiamine-phosphate pyrophosphorylase
VTPLPRFGLYAITDATLTPAQTLHDQVSQAIRGGAAVIQYRDKTSPHEEKLKQAASLLSICRQAKVPLIINDSIGIAEEIKADGVHLGSDDASITEARRRLGSQAIIGASCYNDYQRAVEAQRHGASYVAFGRFFPSPTKPNALQTEIELLHRAKQTLEIPVVAIGGITPENGQLLAKSGADFLAVVAGVFATGDPEHAARRYAQIYYNHLSI